MTKYMHAVIYFTLLIFSTPVHGQNTPAKGETRCEIHLWPTNNYGGVFFGVANGRPNGNGITFDLALTPLESVASKLHLALPPERQVELLSDSINQSGKFSQYTIIVHKSLPKEEAITVNIDGQPSKTYGRKIRSSSSCYAEIHVSFVTAYRTTINKMLMTAFVVRFFSESTEEVNKIITSKLKRGEERIGLTNFDFSNTNVLPVEKIAAEKAFTYMVDRFLRKKVSD